MTNKVCYYELLNLERTASPTDIKKAYKKLAVKWHPDKNPGDPEGAGEMFKLIAEAYEVLSNPETRKKYDLYGHDGAHMSDDDPYDQPRHGGRSRRHPFTNERAFDIFNQFFESFERDMHAMHGGGGMFGSSMFSDPFFDNGPFTSGARNKGGRDRSVGRSHGSMNDPFNDPFFSGGFGSMMGGGMGSMMSDMMSMHGQLENAGGSGMSMSSFSSSSISSNGRSGMRGTSTSTTTVIGADGRRKTRKETTIHHPDGRSETKVEEFTDDAEGGRRGRLVDGQEGGQSRRIPISQGGSSDYGRDTEYDHRDHHASRMIDSSRSTARNSRDTNAGSAYPDLATSSGGSSHRSSGRVSGKTSDDKKSSRAQARREMRAKAGYTGEF